MLLTWHDTFASQNNKETTPLKLNDNNNNTNNKEKEFLTYWNYYKQGWYYYKKQKYAKSLSYYNQALSSCKKDSKEHIYVYAQILYQIGMIYKVKKEYPLALKNLEGALPILEKKVTLYTYKPSIISEIYTTSKKTGKKLSIFTKKS